MEYLTDDPGFGVVEFVSEMISASHRIRIRVTQNLAVKHNNWIPLSLHGRGPLNILSLVIGPGSGEGDSCLTESFICIIFSVVESLLGLGLFCVNLFNEAVDLTESLRDVLISLLVEHCLVVTNFTVAMIILNCHWNTVCVTSEFVK